MAQHVSVAKRSNETTMKGQDNVRVDNVRVDNVRLDNVRVRRADTAVNTGQV